MVMALLTNVVEAQAIWRVLREAGVACIGLFLLLMFFRGVQTKWPESYFQISDIVTYRISTTPIRYAAFRLLPVLVASFLVGVVSARYGLSPGMSVICLAIFHTITTSGRAAAKTLRTPRKYFAREVRLLLYVGLSTMVFGAASIGWALSLLSPLRSVLPAKTEIVSTLWTAGLAGIVGAFLLAVSRGDPPTPEEILRRSKARMGQDLWDLLTEESQRNNADLALVRAVALVENLQRPGWVRSLERVKGKVFSAGTYGVMQVSSLRPLGDEESIRVATRTRFRNTRVRGYRDDLEDQLRAYNSDPTFLSLATDFYYELANAQDDDVRDQGENDRVGTRRFVIGVALAVIFAAITRWRRRPKSI